MAISVFQNFGFLLLKFQKIDFLGKMDPKIQTFQNLKNRNICYSATSRLPVSGVFLSPKSYPFMTSFFSNAIFVTSGGRTQNKWHH